MKETPCANDTVKRAFLFCCYTGLDFATVKKVLKWGMVEENVIVFDRSKTDRRNHLPLTDKAKEFLPKRGKPGELVFDGLGTWEGAVKALRAWATEAGIYKKITWHTARHSLGYRYINEHGGDISILKAILGHNDIKTTQRYAALSEETKREAMDRL